MNHQVILKMNFFHVSLFSALLLLLSCRKEEATFNKFLLLNTSGVIVKIIPTTSMADTLSLTNNQSKVYEFPFERGLSTGDNYAFFADFKPVTVIFNNTDTIIHYFDTLTHTGRYYKPSSGRSFYNKASYEKDIVNDTKYLRTVTLKYIIIAQDYLDAKK